jgi:inosine/xanthosine triphosphatase
MENHTESDVSFEAPPTIVATICTKNDLKLRATKSALKKFFPQAHIDLSAEPIEFDLPQPIGIDMVINGAKKRAVDALNKIKEQRASMIELLDDDHKKWALGIGVEAGLVECSSAISNYMDFQYCVIVDLLGRITIGAGPGWEYPEFLTQQILEGKGKQEIGQLMQKISGNPEIKTQSGAIGFFTNGILNREAMTEIAVQMALIPRMTQGYYTLSKII